mmetsp:Transcript_18365/g.30625  ORF Transcript_18365/g.30625 Transcript_18365/m.30625 type:complete len:911 (+) Transcript_18365:85-2817(+)
MFDEKVSKCTQLRFRLLVLRTTVLASLVCLIIIGGYFSYTHTYENEENVRDSQYMSYVQQLEISVLKNMNRKVHIMSSLAALLTISCPDASHWPNCAVPMPDFLDNTDPTIEMDNLRTVQYAPAVSEGDVPSFEAFAYGLFEKYGYDDLGLSDWGQGIFGRDANGKYRSTEPHPSAGHPYLFPVLQTGNLPDNTGVIMYNVYTGQASVIAIDAMLNCTEGLLTNSTKTHHHREISDECSSITNVLMLAQDGVFNPAMVVRRPITVPLNVSDPSSPLSMVGLVATVNNWNTILSGIIPPSSSKLRVIIRNEVGAWSYDLVDGMANYLEEGALSDKDYEFMHYHFTLPVFKGEVTYSISVYPTSELINDFMTNAPIINCVVSVGVIMLTCIIFIIYDLMVQREAKAQEEAKFNFVRFISHEMRTPLNTVSLGLKLILDQVTTFVMPSSPEPAQDVAVPANVLSEWKDLLLTIENGSDAAEDVLDDLTNYDNISMGLMTYNKRQINIWNAVSECTNMIQKTANEARVTLRLDMAVTREGDDVGRKEFLQTLVALGDEVKIKNVLMNLISNSVRHTKAGGTVSVRVDWSEYGLPYVSAEQSLVRGGSLLIEVKDDGIGMDEESQRSMFSEGHQFASKKTLVGQGSGLGLWISKGIVEKHGGRMKGASAGRDKGSTFVIEIPVMYPRKETDLAGDGDISLHIIDSQGNTQVRRYSTIPSNMSLNDVGANDSDNISVINASPDRLSNMAGAEEGGGHMNRNIIKNILIVDDVAVCRKVLRKTLTISGYECCEAVDGQDCLDKMQAQTTEDNSIDLILLDFEMPRMNGPTAAKHLRDSGCAIPIIGVTGNVLEKDAEYFLEQGADRVIFKPLALELLRKVVLEASEKGSQRDSSPPPLQDGEQRVTTTQEKVVAEQI